MEIASHYHPHPHMQRTYTAPVESSSSAAAAAPYAPASSSSSNTGKRPAHMSTGAHASVHGPSSQLVHSQGHTSSNYSIQSQQSSRNSDTTQGTTHSTLFSPPPPPQPPALPSNAGIVASAATPTQNGVLNPHPSSSSFHTIPNNNNNNNGNEVTATDNVMNTVADASSSLFQICVTLRQRLHGVPEFGTILEEEDASADADVDPVTLLWRLFRRGYPLVLLYDTLRPNTPLQIPQNMKEEKRGKAATFKFIQACITDLKFPQEDCFIITDLYGDDTTGFVKVARVVNRVLDILVQQNLIQDVRPTASDFEQAEKGMKRTQRQHIISELVTTERTYVQHLELLQKFRNLVEAKGVIAGDAIHDIFLNLNALLDFQRRFLIRVEQTNLEAEDQQNWGKLFTLYCEAFRVYEPYIANQKKCEKMVVAEFPKLREAGGSEAMRQMIESPTSLYGFLMKPFQRLSKYPLLLEDLYKKGDLDEERRAELVLGKEAATSVLSRTNAAVDREEKAEAVAELKTRVEDWKGHRVDGFGDLLLYGSFTVVKSESSGVGKDGERQYHVYLFETILLCCKDIDLSKPKNKLSNKSLVDKRGKPKLQLKGRIFMQNVTDLISLAKPGSYTCQIFWKGDPSIENFIIRFASEEMMKKWAQQIESQRRKYHDRIRHSTASSRFGTPGTGTSTTEFEYMRNQPAIKNPYAGVDEDDEDNDSAAETLVTNTRYSNQVGDFSASRNGSQTSLRSRSTTGDSSAATSVQTVVAGGRVPPPRMPSGSLQQLPNQPQLSLRTRELSAQHSPGLSHFSSGGADSYFSPAGADTPLTSTSVRTNTSSANVLPSFPRSQMAQHGYYEEGHGHTRFTAPAMARQRQPSTAAPPPADYYAGPPPATRVPSGPAGLHSAQQMPSTAAARSRSASSPNIQNAIKGPAAAGALNSGAVPMRMQQQQQQPGQPPVPDVPLSYHHQQQANIPRSQSNSPSLVNGHPTMMRGQSYSPQSLRQPGGGMVSGGGPAQFYQQQQQRPPPPFGSFPDHHHGMDPHNSNVSPTDLRTSNPPPPHHHQQSHPHHLSRGTSQAFSPASASTTTTSTAHNSEAFSPSTTAGSPVSTTNQVPGGAAGPTQLKVKVRCPSVSQTLTLVVPLNISYASLRDRIDAKLQRSTNLCLVDRRSSTANGGVNGSANASGSTAGGEKSQVKLKYLDEQDLVSIQSDEDVATAFEAWAEQQAMLRGGTPGTAGAGGGSGGAAGSGAAAEGDALGMGEIELFCQR